MFFLDKRAQVICDELKKEAVRQHIPLTDWEYKEGFYLRPGEADAAGPYENFDGKTMHWYGPDRHYWFRRTLAVPESFQGKTLYLHVRSQIDEWDDGKNPQFLLFVDGEVVQGIDMNHREILLTREAEAGKQCRIDLQAYTGTLHQEFNLIVELREVDPEIEGLYWDLQVPLQGFSRMPEDSRARMDLTKVLNDTVNLLDLRQPYSEAYYASIRKARAYIQEELYGKLGGHDEVIATCIGHTHIDVAWWWTVAQTREKVVRSFATVLKYMDEYPSYRFMSSQPQLYVFLKERYPELFEKIRQRVKEGRWEPEGGMWLEADTNLTSGESLIRQFVHGKRFFREEFGVDNKILWLPDVFGYSGALPQIMKLCGIDYFMTTKLAWNQFNKMPYDTFLWRGIDGSEIFSHLITTLGVGQPVSNFFTTYNGMLHPDALMGGWERYQQKEINNDILISYGYGDGGGGPTRQMLETSERMEKGIEGLPKVRQAFARTYFDELYERVRDSNRLPTWEGELYFEYHRGTLTSMAQNKRGNRKAELALMDLETVSTLASAVPYPAEDLDAMWKTVLLNQFHDILPGSAIREVYEVSRQEYEQLQEKAAALKEERLTALLDGDGESITVFNTKGFDSDEVICLPETAAASLVDELGRVWPVQKTETGAVAYVEDLPSKGYATFHLLDEAADADEPFQIEGFQIETPFYRAAFDAQGFLCELYDLEAERDVLKKGEKGNLLRMFEDKPMYFDDWDIDIFYTEKGWDVEDVRSMAWTECGPVRATLRIEREIAGCTICQDIHFYADSRRIDFETKVDWHVHQHLLKVFFPTDIHSDEATFEIQFGNVKRKVHQNTSWDVARFESCGQKWMDFSEGYYGVSLLNDCKYGHSVKDGVISLTLIKSGIEPNPECDQGEHVFTYALYPHDGDWRCGTVQEAYRLNLPATAFPGKTKDGHFSLCGTQDSNVVLETVKRAEDGDGWIVRVYESDNARTKTALYWGRSVLSVTECNALEEPVSEMTWEADEESGTFVVPFVIKPYEIKTFRIREA
ncbi:MAG: alpha-mannosidase [Clostridia bacterium]|nr:alpha-mannosidase [Clostridia bacterium]